MNYSRQYRNWLSSTNIHHQRRQRDDLAGKTTVTDSPTMHTETTTAPLLTPSAAADLLGKTPNTLAEWRAKGTGPVYIRLGNHPRSAVRYTRDDIHAWQSERSAA